MSRRGLVYIASFHLLLVMWQNSTIFLYSCSWIACQSRSTEGALYSDIQSFQRKHICAAQRPSQVWWCTESSISCKTSDLPIDECGTLNLPHLINFKIQGHVLLHIIRSCTNKQSSSRKQHEDEHSASLLSTADLQAYVAESYKMVSALYIPFKSKAKEQVKRNSPLH